MAKKVNANFYGSLVKNTEKAGAWIAEYSIKHEGIDTPIKVEQSAWTNASACKRWLKAQVIANTPKKSIKLIATEAVDEKGKPIYIAGVVAFKEEA
jgi:hypothetical protein